MVRNPKGMRDILPPETFKWRRLEILLSKAALLYGYGEIRTPILEFSELFRKVWETKVMWRSRKCMSLRIRMEMCCR